MNKELLNILKGKTASKVHCTIHSSIVDSLRGEQMRLFRNSGFTIAEKNVSAYQTVLNDVSIEASKCFKNNRLVTTNTYKTPKGQLTESSEIGPHGSPWTKEYLVKSAPDVATFKHIIEHTNYYPNYSAVEQAEERLGSDGIVVCRVVRSPLQSLIVEQMGAEQTILSLYEYPAEMEDLLEAMRIKFLQAIELTAKSPAHIVWSAENITSMITSPSLFEKFCLPFYNEAADILHVHGKLYGVHMDGSLLALKNLIAQLKMDFIEGFTPPPMGDLEMVEAMQAWPGKVLWVNFPATVFMKPEREIIDYTVELLKTGFNSRQFLLTIAEDLPDWQSNLAALAKGIKRFSEKIS